MRHILTLFPLQENKNNYRSSMLSVGQLASLILSLEPQKSPARLAFYHFLKNFLPLEVEFKPHHLDSFYDRSMTIQHWQIHRKELAQTVRQDLELLSSRHALGFNADNWVHADEVQWIEVELGHDFEALLSREQQILEENDEVVKHVPLESSEVLRIRLQQTGEMIVESKPRQAFIDQGEIRLVRPTSRLTYDSDYELNSDAVQVLNVSHTRTAVFKMNNQKVSGFIVQGYTFVKTENLNGTIQDHWDLLQALKRYERHYINPITDRDYAHLTEQLEKTINLVKSYHPDREMIANEMLRKGDQALKDLFPNDRFLYHLVSTLRYLTTSKGTSESWNQTQSRSAHIAPLRPLR